MATLISGADGNFTTAGTWKVVDATSFLDTVTAATSSTTAGANSTAFTPGAITVEGIVIQIRDRSSSLGGTITASVWNTTANALVAGTAVTINISDLPDTYNSVNARGMGWVYFKFASPVTLLAATNYAVRVTTSVNSSANVYVSAGGGTNWSRGLVTSTTAAPASTDVLIITGEHTGAGVNATRTVTMNNTTATAFGQTYVSVKGTMSYGTSLATAYNLRLTGNLFVTSNGTLNIGTALSPIPAGSTAVLEFNTASGGQYGLTVSGGNFNAYGQSKTQYVRLAADAAVSATNLTLTSIPTNWLNGDIIGITGTTTTATQAEVRNLSANVATTTATVSAGLTNAHGGNSTTLVQGHVANLTRNVIIRAVTATLPAYSQYSGTDTTVNISSVLFSAMGSTTTTTPAVGLFTAAVSRNLTFNMSNSVIYQPTVVAGSLGFYQLTTSLTSPVSYTFTNNVIWNVQGASIQNANSSAISTKDLSGNLSARSATVTINDPTADTSNLVVANSNSTSAIQLQLNSLSAPFPNGTVSTLTNLETYGNTTYGINFNTSGTSSGATGKAYINVNNLTSWRNGTSAIYFNGFEFVNTLGVLSLDNARSFGSGTSAIIFSTVTNATVIFKNSTFWGGTTLVTPTCITTVNTIAPSPLESVLFTDCTFGKDHLGNTSSFTTSILGLIGLRAGINFQMYNPTTTGTLVSRSTAVPNATGYLPGIIVQKLNGVAGSDFVYTNSATISLDSSIFRTSAPSTRLAPAIAVGVFVPSSTVRIPVKSGQTSTVSVWVRKSVLGDGTAYNGGQPTLILRPNLAAGNLDNTTLATMTAAAGTWEQLTYTTGTVAYDTVLDFAIVCDGNTGWINIDEWDTTSSNDTRNDFIQSSVIGQYVEPDYNTGSGGSASANAYIG